MGIIADSYEFTADTTLVASWTPKMFTIMFDVAGGTGVVEAITVSYGSTFSFPVYAGTKEGFIFAGWNLQPNQITGTEPGTTSLPVTGNATYYAVWISDTASINPDLKQRKIERHAGGEGSIIETNVFGKSVYLLVPDAKYRSEKAYRLEAGDIPELSNFNTDFKFISPNDTADINTAPLTFTTSDRELQSRFSSLSLDKSAKENTNILMQYEDTEAAHYCRSINISGLGGMDLPNSYETMVIYAEADRIDELDPTISEYPQYALGTSNSNGRFGFAEEDAWTSTENGSGDARYVSNNGSASFGPKNVTRGVIPVLELDVHDVIFDVNGGSVQEPSIKVPHGHNFTLPYYSGAKEGFAFAGWSTSKGQEYGVLPGERSEVINDFTTFYACWRESSINPNLAQRNLFRHANNEGTVVQMDNFGRPVNLFIPDAKYRTSYKTWGRYGTDVPNLANFSTENKQINPSGASDERNEDLTYTMTDKQLQQRFPSLVSDMSAHENTDALMQYEDTAAAHYCRSLEIAELGGMDLPALYELAVLYVESDRIDALDPTISEYKQFALGKTNTYGRFDMGDINIVWSSTEYDADHAIFVNSNGAVNDGDKFNTYGVIPVKELQGEHCIVSFNPDGGSKEVTSIFVEKGGTIRFPAYNGTKDGFSFAGWNNMQGQTSGSIPGEASPEINADTVYYAAWSGVTVLYAPKAGTNGIYFEAAKAGTGVNFFKEAAPEGCEYEVWINGELTDQAYNVLTFAKGDKVLITSKAGEKYPWFNAGDGNYIAKMLEPLPLLSKADGSPVTDMSNCFSGNTSLISAPAELFENNTEAVDFDYCFTGCMDFKVGTNIVEAPVYEYDSEGNPIRMVEGETEIIEEMVGLILPPSIKSAKGFAIGTKGVGTVFVDKNSLTAMTFATDSTVGVNVIER